MFLQSTLCAIKSDTMCECSEPYVSAVIENHMCCYRTLCTYTIDIMDRDSEPFVWWLGVVTAFLMRYCRFPVVQLKGLLCGYRVQ